MAWHKKYGKKIRNAIYTRGIIFTLTIFSGAHFPAHASEMAGESFLQRPVVLKSVTLEGGPVGTKHIQAGREDYRERHGLGILKFHTKDHGNWALYLLAPNSVDNTSIGLGYVTNPYVLPAGPFKLELSGGLGLVTGYQDYPVPLLAAEARLVLFEKGAWDAGLSVAANPYYMQEKGPDGDHHFGVVVTSPFLSVRYNY